MDAVSHVWVELTVLVGGVQLLLEDTELNRDIILNLLEERNRIQGDRVVTRMSVLPDVNGEVQVAYTQEVFEKGWSSEILPNHIVHFRTRAES